MRKIFSKFEFSLFLLLLLISCIFFSFEKNVATVKADTQTVTPYATPTSDPIVFLGIWFTNGYSLQPESDYYTQIGQSIIIHTSASRSIWTVLTGLADSPHYRWFESTDYGKNWSSVSEDNGGHRMNFPVTPKTAGTTWYQLDTQYYTLLTPFLKTHIYSKVTAVHVKDPVNATKLNVTADNDYIYNESSSDLAQNHTFIHAYPDPADATGKITYTVDKPNLASFAADIENGGTTNQLVAKAGAVGKVRVTATMQNPNGTTVSGYKDIQVGGGLDDQKVRVGQPATFKMHGNVDGTNSNANGCIQIKWYKYDKDGNKTTVATSNSSNYQDYVDYTIPKTTMDDNNTQYQAQITVSLLGGIIQTDSLTTNKANLTVENDPDISITSKVVNNTYDDGTNTDDLLNKVTNNDQVSYEFDLKNNNDNSVLTEGNYVIPLHKETKVNKVELDGNKINSDNYSLIDDSDENSTDLVISGLDFDNSIKSHQVTVDTTVSGINNKEKFKSTPYYYGNDYGTTVYRKEAIQHEINYVNNDLNATVSNLNFGTISSGVKNHIQYRSDEENLPNNIVNIDDQRRDKKAMKVYVSQPKSLGNSLSLRYYENGKYTNLSKSNLLINAFDKDNVSSIGWKKDDGILLYIGNTNPIAGKYSTELDWTFDDSI
ncbi:hypothetical protein [Companilactobacillus crustorum]|uniref:hypothetical protein n=2 Tax=Companilactobacillus crustorum TaxID=392416 RepID=UPI0009579D39|nr:hypothetical protein [Companilactobacillus crustorum]APU70993.1 hypothetical protein BI355_0670 [Companilactobacillus crustorum]